MATEIEAKLSVEDHEPVRDALRRADAVRVGRVFERNYVLDLPDGSLRQRGAALRVRAVETLEGERRSGCLTYKGPARKARFKSREEIEIEIADADGALTILTACGLVVTLLYEKRRETWRCGDCLVELDEVPVLGLYVEIEGPTDDAITETCRLIGLAATPHVPAGYVAMLSQYCTNCGIADREVRFDTWRA